ncbi:dienelactone hydrolase family protein [Acidimicrobiales bacterium]|nr:dienelactone hydrolase family protein [Acidimicrobiales bacterium]
MPLADYSSESFTNNGITHEVFHRGSGPCVLVAPEIPGVTPAVVAFADRVVDLGMSVAIPSMFGTPGKPSTRPRAIRVLIRSCISREFHAFALGDTAPATVWLRALARSLHERHGGPGIGFVGMCFTGGYGLAMMREEAVIAPVLSQPSQPLPLGKARSANVGLDAAQLRAVAERAEAGCPVLGLRFTSDPAVPAQRFETLRAALGEHFLYEEITSPDDSLDPRVEKLAHSVLTEDLAPDSKPEHPTQVALNRTLDFLTERLLPAAT